MKPTCLLFILLTLGAGDRADVKFLQTAMNQPGSLMEGTASRKEACEKSDVQKHEGQKVEWTTDAKYRWKGEGKYTVECDEIGTRSTFECTKEQKGNTVFMTIEEIDSDCKSKEKCPGSLSKKVQRGDEVFQADIIDEADLGHAIELTNKCPKGTNGKYVFLCTTDAQSGAAKWQFEDRCVKSEGWCEPNTPRYRLSTDGPIYTAVLPAVDPTAPKAQLKFKVVEEKSKQPRPCEEGQEGYHYYKCVSGVWKQVNTCCSTEPSSEFE